MAEKIAPQLNADFTAASANASANIGKRQLTDQQLILLACGEIAKSHTYEEKDYS